MKRDSKWIGLATTCLAGVMAAAEPSSSHVAAAEAAQRVLIARHGEGERTRIERGVAQVLRAWQSGDGDAAALQKFVEAEFVPQGPALDATFERLEFAFERVQGYFNSLNRDLHRGLDLDLGPQLPIDDRLGGWDPGSHVLDDLFANRIAFVVLLNFPRTTLSERLRDGAQWSRRQWAEARLTGQFVARTPAAALAGVTSAQAEAEAYVNGYNLRVHHLLTRDGRRLFRPGLRLINHWNLRDELKSAYSDAEQRPALERQRLIALAMEAIVRQQIPQAVIDNPLLDWLPETGEVRVSSVRDGEPPADARAEPSAEREPDTRYARWKALFDAEREVDRSSPDHPTFLSRRFDQKREIPADEAERLFEALLDAPLGAKVAQLVARRLGRPLEPHDIWYAGFKARAGFGETELDTATQKRYPSAEAFSTDLPRLLRELGFSAERASFLAERIAVEPSRGAGHALGALRRDDRAHLRTRVGKGGMDYKGYNIAVHELGHNVEQVFSMTTIDHTLLQGVPNNAFTEALAFLFQAHDLRLLGLASNDPNRAALQALESFWTAREISGVALVDLRAWQWLYAHPGASPAEFRAAVVGIAEAVWNRHFAALLGRRDVALLGIYAHLVSYELYTPDYALGHLIAFQVQAHFDSQPGPMGAEFERLCQLGALTPDLWMRKAVGAPLSAQPLIEAAERALVGLEQAKPKR